MSLDVYLTATRPTTVFEWNITHNLNKMAEVVGLYEPLWRPEEIGVKYAVNLEPMLVEGLQKLRDRKEELQALNPSNGWGTYDGLVKFVEEYIEACRENPDAIIYACR